MVGVLSGTLTSLTLARPDSSWRGQWEQTLTSSSYKVGHGSATFVYVGPLNRRQVTKQQGWDWPSRGSCV